jgi:hypothetical protein
VTVAGHPIPECSKIENLARFFNGRIDALYVDGRVPAEAAQAVVGPGEGRPGARRFARAAKE